MAYIPFDAVRWAIGVVIMRPDHIARVVEGETVIFAVALDRQKQCASDAGSFDGFLDVKTHDYRRRPFAQSKQNRIAQTFPQKDQAIDVPQMRRIFVVDIEVGLFAVDAMNDVEDISRLMGSIYLARNWVDDSQGIVI